MPLARFVGVFWGVFRATGGVFLPAAGAARDAGVEIRHPFRVESVEKSGDDFVVVAREGTLRPFHCAA